MFKVIGILALAVLSIASPAPAPTAALDFEKRYSCYTSTVTTPYTGPVYCPFIPATCPPHPDCIILEHTTTTIPGPNKNCPVTPTVTVTGLGVCPTCQTGCGTDIVTVTVTA